MVLPPQNRGPNAPPEPRYEGGGGFEGPGPRWGESPRPPARAERAPAPSGPDRAPGSVHRAPPTFVTIGLVVVNVAVLALMGASGIDVMSPHGASLVSWGSNYGPSTLTGEWWRLVTSCFVHGGLIHLAFNMYVLWDLGRLTERVFGAISFSTIYLVAGIGGSFASVVRNPDVNSVGASGAVFGVAGMFLAFLLVNRARIRPDVAQHLRRSLLTFVLLNVAIGFAVPMIDQAAHLGGLATGFVSGLIASPRVGPDGPVRAYARLPIVAGIGIALCAITGLGVTLRLLAH